MVEASLRRPNREIGAPKIGEAFLEAWDDFSRVWIARRNRAARAGVAALEIHFANAEAHGTAFSFAKELIFPERRDTVDFERGAEALARFVDLHAIEQFAYSLQRCRGNDCRPVGDVVVGEALCGVTDGDGLLEKAGKPLGGRCGIAGEGECLSGNCPAISGNRQGDGADVWRECRANQVNRRGALAVHPLPIRGIERPGAVEFEPAARADTRFAHVRRVKRLDRVKTNVGEAGRWTGRNHGKILAEGN